MANDIKNAVDSSFLIPRPALDGAVSQTGDAQDKAKDLARQTSQLVFHQLVTSLLETVESESPSEEMFQSFMAEAMAKGMITQGAGDAFAQKVEATTLDKINGLRAYANRTSTLMEAA